MNQVAIKSIISTFPPLILLMAGGLLVGCSSESRQIKLLESGNRHYEAEAYEAAEIQFKNLLKEDPGNSQGIAALGMIWRQQGSPVRAIPYLIKASELNSTDVMLRVELAEAWISLGNVSEARNQAREMLAIDSGSDAALMILTRTCTSAEELEELAGLVDGWVEKDSAGLGIAAAKVALLNGDPDGALSRLAEVIARHPDSVPARVAMAEVQAGQENMKAAMEELRAASERAPLRSEVRLRYAATMAHLGMEEEADQWLSQLTAQAPDFLSAWVMRAKLALLRDSQDEALGLIERVLAHDPENPDGLLFKAGVLINQGKGDEAVQLLDPLLRSFPGSRLGQVKMAKGLFLSGNSRRAEEILKSLLAADPDDVEAGVLLSRSYLVNGSAPAAIEILEKLRHAETEGPVVERLLAEAYRLVGRTDDAIEAMREQVGADPENFDLWFRFGVLLLQKGHLEEAGEALARADTLLPGTIQVMQRLVELDLARNEGENAHARVNKALEQVPGSASLHALKAGIYGAERQWDRAEAMFRKSIELDENHMESYGGLVSVYLASERLVEAAVELDRLADSPEAATSTLILAATIHQQLGGASKAIDLYERILKEEPESPLVLNNLAYLYGENSDDLDLAHALAMKLRRLQPHDPVAAETLGWIEYRRGYFGRALSLIEEGFARFPENPEVAFHLGMANAMMGRETEARNLLEKALSASTDFPGRTDAETLLEGWSRFSGDNSEITTTALRESLKARPDDVVGWLKLGAACELVGDSVGAIESYQTAFSVNPELLAAAKKLAQLHFDLGRSSEAAGYARIARDLAPDDDEVEVLMGRLAFRERDFTQAYLNLAVAPAGSPARYDRGRAAYALGMLEVSREVMERLVTEAPESRAGKDAGRFLEMLDIERRLDEPEISQGRVDEVLELDPSHGPALMLNALLASAQGEKESAAAAYKKVFEFYPDHPGALRELAILYSMEEETLDAAYDFGRRAMETFPEDVRLVQAVIRASYLNKEYEKTIELVRRSQSRGKAGAEEVAYLGLAQLSLGQGEALVNLRIAAGSELDVQLGSRVKQALAAAEWRNAEK